MTAPTHHEDRQRSPRDTIGMPASPPIVVTGAAGRLGRAAVRGLLAAGLPVRAFDRKPAPAGTPHVGDLTAREPLATAMAGAAALVHLAATPDDDDFATRLLPDNLVGLHAVLEAARVAGVTRVVLASTGQVNWWQEQDGPWPVRITDPPSPRGWYAVTKVALEAAGMVHARSHGMTVIAARLGWCPRTRAQAAELAASERGPQVYLSPGDAARFFVAAVTHPVPGGYHVVFATSRPRDQLVLDLDPARALVGWEPHDMWPTGVDDDIG